MNMHGNNRDLKKFFAMIRGNEYPKNGSWKDAPELRDLTMAHAFVMAAIVALAAAKAGGVIP